ncbi:hypothetical protein L6452_02976 [Arctium lappa]|uniref:Uncharacterized protein n=1 Tax=Arctium lappa TaxID=4217 RepID=A0ACB9FMJ5_ARCLA|nr:hypothetical protein L6452_02976 [Arctium lappa]
MASGSAAGDGVFGGCISSDDIGIQRRPYHRNCNCALHKSDEQHHCSHASFPKVSYPIRRSWSEGCLVAMMASAGPSPGSSPCCPSSPAPIASSAARLPPHVPIHQLNR